ncbi:hypothetical protein G5C65_05915 [Streptomyces sp. SB3404]|uniref:Uncharacterized protein n=2 Tax=Streptomyces boncukensis TaxID=2711219 RepID=A0A6G4WTD4_9ACTN|nr:hypothetical protein [Streptomyces boncukensis]
MQPLPPSYEQIRDRVAQAVRRLLATEDGTWSCVEATYPDRVIVSVHEDAAEPTTYAIPYEATGPDVTLGTLQPVELTTVVIPDQGPAREATGAEAAENRVVQPTIRALADVTARIQAADGPGQLAPVRATVSELMDALSAKGLDVTPGDDDSEPSPAAPVISGIDLWDDDPYDEDHGDTHDVPAPDSVGTRDDEPENTVRLGADEVKAQLAAFQFQR